ncbi:MAG: carboxylesterase family protein, partial [Mucilaginibacter sp.]
WYIFHSLRHSWRPFTAGDEELSKKMVDFWTNFAKSGNPNGKLESTWKPYTAQNPQFLLLDADKDKAVFSMTATPQYKGSGLNRR